MGHIDLLTALSQHDQDIQPHLPLFICLPPAFSTIKTSRFTSASLPARRPLSARLLQPFTAAFSNSCTVSSFPLAHIDLLAARSVPTANPYNPASTTRTDSNFSLAHINLPAARSNLSQDSSIITSASSHPCRPLSAQQLCPTPILTSASSPPAPSSVQAQRHHIRHPASQRSRRLHTLVLPSAVSCTKAKKSGASEGWPGGDRRLYAIPGGLSPTETREYPR